MGTRSMIIIEEEGRYCGVYCHWDGYLEHNGEILLSHYHHTQKVRALVGGGDMSSLAAEVDDCAYYNIRGDNWEDVKPFHCSTIGEVVKVAGDADCEFVYVFNKNEERWKFAERGPQFFGLSDESDFSEFEFKTLSAMQRNRSGCCR